MKCMAILLINISRRIIKSPQVIPRNIHSPPTARNVPPQWKGFIFVHLYDISIIFVSMNQALELSRLEQTIFYVMDKTIKSYRQFARQNIKRNDLDITIDQWLVLKTIKDNPEMTQNEISKRVFKDHASVTRIIEILVQRKYLTRSFNDLDRRRYKLELTELGKKIYNDLVPIIYANRKTALSDVSTSEIKMLEKILEKITKNCSQH